jgi:hypothetical protein
MRLGLRSVVVGGLLVTALAGCGSTTVTVGADDPVPEPAGGTAPAATRTAGPEMTGMASPPPFRVRYDDQELVLAPFTFCFESGCADGVPTDVVSVGSPDEVRVFVPVEGWILDATVTTGDSRCGRQQALRPERRDGWFTLRPVGLAGDKQVDLFAHGRGGDMVARFAWRATQDGPLPEPEAVTALIADHDGRPDSYGVELSLSNLATTPESATARVTVTAANGRSLTFAAHRSRQDCLPEGTVFFDGPDSSGRDAADLGDFPFRYDVVVTLDGTTHRATASYPADEIDGNEPSVRLDFDPPLPALG